MSREDTEERVAVRVTANLLLGVGLVALFGLAACGLDPVSADFGCKIRVSPNEKIETNVEPLQAPVRQDGATAADSVRTGSPGRHGGDVVRGIDSAESAEHAGNAPNGCPDPSLVHAKSGRLAGI